MLQEFIKKQYLKGVIPKSPAALRTAFTRPEVYTAM